jgi:hypothetical protein
VLALHSPVIPGDEPTIVRAVRIASIVHEADVVVVERAEVVAGVDSVAVPAPIVDPGSGRTVR